MNTKSLIMQKILAVFIQLNNYFEYSFLYKLLAGIGRLSKSSKIVGFFKKGIFMPQKTDYLEGSVYFKYGSLFIISIMKLCKKMYLSLSKANESSFNKMLFNMAIQPLTTLEGALTAGFTVLSGIFALLFAYFLVANGNLVLSFVVLFLISGLVSLSFTGLLATGIKGSIPFKLVAWSFREDY